jgi:hypothetical protein
MMMMLYDGVGDGDGDDGDHHDTRCVMRDVWCKMCDWCTTICDDIWWYVMIYDIWYIMFDVWWWCWCCWWWSWWWW